MRSRSTYACQGGAAGTVTLSASRVADDRQRAHWSECTFSEKALPRWPVGRGGPPTYRPNTNKVTVVTGHTVEAKVTNTISRDTGSLKVTKVFAKPAGLTVPADAFKIDYACQGRGPRARSR